MGLNKKQDDFLRSIKIVKNDIVSVIGTGGKNQVRGLTGKDSEQCMLQWG